MKKIYLGLLVLLLLASCNKDTPPVSLFTYTVNGTQWYGSNYNATYNHTVYQFSSSLFAGDTATHTYMVVEWGDSTYAAPGTYAIDSLYGRTTFNLTYVSGNNLYFGKSGSVVLSQLDTIKHQVSGTFTFTGVNVINAADTVAVTNGIFTGLVYTVK